jgi:protein-arginine kinase activator protein McsA
MTLTELNNLLSEVLDSEDYIRAIAIRDEINSRNAEGKQ